jgi:hypothetical protein
MPAPTAFAPRFESSSEVAIVDFDFSYAEVECNSRAIEESLILLRITCCDWETLREIAQQIAAHPQNSATTSFEWLAVAEKHNATT